MNISFQYPQAFWLLLLLPLILLIYILYRSWKARVAARLGNKVLVKSLFSNHSFGKETIKFSLLAVAIALGLLALSNPRQRAGNSGEERKGIDIIIALDVSYSMLATDVPPLRLTNAQQLLRDVVTRMPNDRIGLILFAGRAYVQMPLSIDHNAARMFISTAHPDAVPEKGTAIGEALKQADLAFDDNPRFKTIILVTDGETHDEGAVEEAARLAKKGVMINTIGIGSPQGATILDTAKRGTRTDESGNVVISKLNEELLMQIAQQTNGIYTTFQNKDQVVNALMQQYKDVDRKALEDESTFTYASFYMFLLIPMVLLLVLEIFFPDKRRIKNEN